MYSAKHSAFSSSFPVYLFEVETKEVPDEEAIAAAKAAEEAKKAEEAAKAENEDEEEAIVEDADEEKKPEQPEIPTPMKNVTVEKWAHLNAQPPLWQRDPKTIEDGKYSICSSAPFALSLKFQRSTLCSTMVISRTSSRLWGGLISPVTRVMVSASRQFSTCPRSCKQILLLVLHES